MKGKNNYNDFRSPIPPHLSEEELKEWQKEMEWEEEEKKRRAEQGMYKRKRGKKLKKRKSKYKSAEDSVPFYEM